MKGNKAQAKAQAAADREAARQRREQAIERRAVGHYEYAVIQKQGRRLLAAQRVAIGGSGLASDDAGAEYIADKTVEQISVNSLMAMHNADVEAAQLDKEAVALESGANNTLAAARRQNTALAFQTAGTWASLYGDFGGGKGSVGGRLKTMMKGNTAASVSRAKIPTVGPKF